MVSKFKFLILGAGPSGLAFASELLKLKETSFLIIDSADGVGGLCRSKFVDGSPLDVGGGHFLDVKRKKVLDFLFDFLPEREWNIFERNSKIQINELKLDYPYEANIWQLPIDGQIEHLISIMNSGCNRGEVIPEKFSDWITWKLGKLIANNYLLPYNSKIFANIKLDELGTYWLHKLPNVSIEEILRSCLEKKFYGSIPAHSSFLYPKQFGYGEVFDRIGQSLSKNLLLNYKIKKLNFETLI